MYVRVAWPLRSFPFFFAVPAPAPPEISPLSLHDALPISNGSARGGAARRSLSLCSTSTISSSSTTRSEEHTSELQSPCNLVCRLLLEKKKKDGGAEDKYKNHTKRTRATASNRQSKQNITC